MWLVLGGWQFGIESAPPHVAGPRCGSLSAVDRVRYVAESPYAAAQTRALRSLPARAELRSEEWLQRADE
ncbi:hypothetical protein GCM10023319_26880 [Nocardia iowensis]